MQKTQYKFVSEFKCLREKCVDTCCGNWRVNINKESYYKLTHILAEPEVKEKIDNAISVTQESDARYAVINHSEEGYCQFLQGGLCDLHTRYGENILPSVCMSYPRIENTYYLERVVSASLSCPEIVRLLSQHDEPYAVDANELVREDGARVFNVELNLRDKLTAVMRHQMINICELNSTLTPAQILYAISEYSVEIAEVYEQETLRESDFKKVNEIHEKYIQIDNVIAILSSEFAFDSNIYEPIMFVTAILALRDVHIDDGLTRFVREIYIALNKHLGQDVDWDNTDDVVTSYRQIIEGLSELSSDLKTKYLTLYIENTLRRENPGRMKSFFVFCHMLNIRFAILSFVLTLMLYGNPEAGDDECIKLIYLFARAFDHDADMMMSIYDAMQHENLFSLHYARNFLHV